MLRLIITSGLLAAATVTAVAEKAAVGKPFVMPPQAEALLANYCFDCHEDGTTKGDVQLDNLASLPLDARLDLMNRMLEQAFVGEMPPKKKDQPTEVERNQLVKWLSQELNLHGASKLEEKMRKPEFGNVVDHEKLFSGKYKDLPAFTPDRRWLVSEFIFDAKFNKLVDFKGHRNIDGKRQNVTGDNIKIVNMANPFLLPTNSGVRYYDTTTLDGGHLLTMIANAREFSRFTIEKAKGNNYPPALAKIMATEWGHDKIIAGREKYMTDQIEPLLRELFKDKHESLLPMFVAPKPPAPEPDDGKPKSKPFFDMGGYSVEEKDVFWRTYSKNYSAGARDENLIQKCSQDWFHLGLDLRAIGLRTALMRRFGDQLPKLVPPSFPDPLKPPAEPELTIIREALLKQRKPEDTYRAVMAKCLAEWREQFKQERLKAGGVAKESIENMVVELFTIIFERAPSAEDQAEYLALMNSYFPKLGGEKAIRKLIETLILRTDFVYRQEFGAGNADAHGRKMLSPRDASYALAYALTDSSPDKQLAEAAATGKLSTREDYRREVERMLKARDQYYVIEPAVENGGGDSFTNLPIRKLRFFREFFGYPGMLAIFKDNKRFGGSFNNVAAVLVSEADKLVEHILLQDKDVFEQLLTTEEFYVYHSGDDNVMQAASEKVRKHYEYFKDKDWKNFDVAELKKHVPFLKQNPMRGLFASHLDTESGLERSQQIIKQNLTSYTIRLDKGQKTAVPFPAFSSHDGTEAMSRSGKSMWGVEVAKNWNIDIANWNYPTEQPVKVEHRRGILTHPAWLMAFAKNTETDPIHRGKWVREKLLAGTIPDVPITVDAKIPEDHTQTLRSRLDKVTTAEYCWKCHERMNPLGTPFEMYDDFGRYRIEEFLEHPDNLVKKMPDKGPTQDDLRDIYKTLPVEPKGGLTGTGDPALDGDVKDALDLTTRLSKSAKVRQSIIRHAFRYFMGRNEFLSDSKTLIDADEAYVKSGGSFDAVILSLLTSDSFIYRKPASN